MSVPTSLLGLKANNSEDSRVMTDNSQQSQSSVLPEQAQVTAKENLEDYETQLFGFTPRSFVSGIYNAVSEYFTEALQSLEDYLSKHYSDTMSASEIGERMQVVRQHLVTKIDKAFDTLETYLANNIFCVPTNVILPEDQVQVNTPVSQQDFSAVQDGIQCMKKNILAVKLANAVLKQRLQYTMQLQEMFDNIVERLNSAQAIARQEGVVDLHDSLSHCAQTVLSTVRLLSNIQVLYTQGGPSQADRK
ncbi:protein MIS12 homolog [Babylonia areolata]|uniref:protein MIS12 homolog n=1 Tax=Babylonia areolata TaxID=304850 RepID=UPI003FD064AC